MAAARRRGNERKEKEQARTRGGRGGVRGMLSRSFTGPSIDAFGRAFMNEVPPPPPPGPPKLRAHTLRSRCRYRDEPLV